jgi:hypothetical protein
LAIVSARLHIHRMSDPKPDSPKTEIPKPATPAGEKTPTVEREIGGPKGPEPTRFGDWEVNGRCTDF